VFPISFACGPLPASKNNHRSPLAHVNTECPDEGYPKLKICISKLILVRYKHINSRIRESALHDLTLLDLIHTRFVGAGGVS